MRRPIERDDTVRFRDGNDVIEGRVHSDFDRDLAVVIATNGRRWMVARDAMAHVDAPPAPS